MNLQPTRAWYARKLPQGRYRVTCRHLQDGFEEDCGTTMPKCTRDYLLEWFLENVNHQEKLIINDAIPLKELLS